MSKLKTHVKRGDYVQVISGDHKGRSGVVLQVLPTKQQVIVEGVRLIKKTVRKSQEHPEGAILEREGPLHISNVKLSSKAPAEAAPKKKAPAKKKKAATEASE